MTGLLDYAYLDVVGCQYGVYDSTAYEDGYTSDCGKPAVAKAWWGDREEESILVCEEHLRHLIEIDKEEQT